ncbi:hypothetical protein [Chryseobacterium indoltheticum]|uniref:hypothetical protein n=1 Tax=Chryseobacterium indoltheticum TaxID=254 RepID=UPI003F493EA2
MNKYAYKAEIEHITKQIDRIKRIDAVNNKLFEYNWVFLHPYNQGFEITYFENILIDSNPNDIEKLIFERFAKNF